MALAFALHLQVLLLAPHFVVFIAVLGNAVFRTAQREVHLENGFKRTPMVLALHQGCGKRVFKCIAIFDRNFLDRFHRIQVFGEAYWQTRIAEFDNKARHQVENWHLINSLVDRQFLRRFGNVRLVFEKNVQRVFCLLSIDVIDAEQDQCSCPVERFAY